MTDDSDRILGRARPARLARTTTSSRATSTRTATATSPARSAASLDGTGTSAFGDQTIKTQRPGGGLDAHLQPDGRERVPLLLVAGQLRRRAPAVRPAPPTGAAVIPGSITDPASSRAASRASPIDGYFGGPGLGRIGSPGLPAEVPAHEPVRVHGHAVLAARQPRAEVRRGRRSSMKNEYMDVPATRGACASATASPATRWPTSCSATCPTSSSRTSTWSTSGTGPACSSSRTTGR